MRFFINRFSANGDLALVSGGKSDPLQSFFFRWEKTGAEYGADDKFGKNVDPFREVFTVFGIPDGPEDESGNGTCKTLLVSETRGDDVAGAGTGECAERTVSGEEGAEDAEDGDARPISAACNGLIGGSTTDVCFAITGDMTGADNND